MSEENTNDINHVPSSTPDFQTDLARKLHDIVPEAIADGKVDTQKLKELLDGDSADDSERFGLFWPGKKRAMRAAQEPTTATLKPAKDESKDWDTTQNLFIEGDNLEVLKVLQKHYHNKIKMIYIDPPYNTGKDFVYPDNYKEGLASYLEFTKQVDEEGRKISTNSDTDGRYHSNWLNMMYPRLKLARNLLTDDGVIFVSIDDNEQPHLRKILDEIFGEDRFIAQISWRRQDGQTNIGTFARVKEYVLAYGRGDSVDLGRLPLSEKAKKDYQYKDEKGYYGRGRLREPVRGRYNYTLTSPSGTKAEGPWLISETDFRKLEDQGLVHWPENGGSPRKKIYLSDMLKKGQIPNDFWGIEYGTNQRASLEVEALFKKRLFDFPKPVSLLTNLVNIGSTRSDDIILDFFSGSGTTAHAVMKLNAEDGGSRRHIQVQLPEPTEKQSNVFKAGYSTIAELSIERIRLAGEKIKADYSEVISNRDSLLDTGYRVYKLSDSNFTKWRTDSTTDKDSLQQHLLEIRESSNDAASEEDLLTEVLLKQGISLTAPITHEHIDGLSVWIVGDNTVSAYLNEREKPSLDQLRAITAKEPAKFIIIEDAFQGDDELKTNLVQICKSQKIELWTV